MTDVLSRKELLTIFTRLEAGEGEAGGWAQNPRLSVFTGIDEVSPPVIGFREVPIWE
ncbi:hypothetical protein Aros01_08640 [Streptosporangium roseum]|uniref:hypothetical protein n=1 Tax=Streptosporangium roseum TaxID=2001 RepID=UPI0030A1402A